MLRLQRTVTAAPVDELAGIVTAPSRGKARKLSDFDPASLMTKPRR